MLRAMLDARPLVAMLVATGIGAWGLYAYPFPRENVFLELIALQNPPVSYQTATPGYFRAMRIPMLRGRAFDARDRAGEEALPRMLDERVGAEADRHQPERERERDPAAGLVDDRADDRAGDEPDRGARSDDEPSRREVDVADVVEVDEEERVGEPISERIDQRTGLQRPYGARQGWVQRPQVRAQEVHGNGTYPRLD